MNVPRKAGARLLGQAVLAIVVLMALVGGVTFYFMYQEGMDWGPEPPPPPPPTEGKPLKFREEISDRVIRKNWDPPTQGEFEENTDGYYDFWFDNPHDVPIELGVGKKSCKCTVPSVCVLSPEEAQRYKMGFFQSAAAEFALSGQGFPPLLAQMKVEQVVPPALNWQPLAESEEHGITVGPHQSGMVRVAWDGAKAQSGSQLLQLGIWSQPQENGPAPRTRQVIELPVFFSSPLQFLPQVLDVGDLDPQGTRELSGVCWSSTRAWFSLKAEEKRGEPFFHCTWTPLTERERDDLAESLRKPAQKDQEAGPKPRVLYGYQIHVTVQERVSEGTRMDLGPFTRKVVVSGPGGLVAEVPMTGLVRGEIQVGGQDDNGRIKLGQFKARQGMKKTVRLTANRPGLKLRYERMEPDNLAFLNVDGPREVGTGAAVTQWDLRVEMKPGVPRLLEHCAVVLRMSSPESGDRLIRIPVTGAAYQ
jgi:hypothetical protein